MENKIFVKYLHINQNAHGKTAYRKMRHFSVEKSARLHIKFKKIRPTKKVK